MPERLLTVKEAAERTGHKEATWRAWILRRKVPYHKFGRSIRIAESDLTRMIDESRIPAHESRRAVA
jgi:excisionase family DNA binding protein